MDDEIFSTRKLYEALQAINLSYNSNKTEVLEDGLTWKESKIKEIVGDQDVDTNRVAIPFYKKNAVPGKDLAAGYVIQVDDEILISYRGTIGLSEIANDLRAKTSPIKLSNGENINIHAGFNDEYQQSKKSMNAALYKMREMNNSIDAPITFTGHSLGAAISQIAALDQITATPKENIQVVTFGGPRVFDNSASQVYNKHLEKNTLRIKVAGDHVTNVPPKPPYMHAGEHITMKTRNKASGTHIMPAYNDLLNQIFKKHPEGVITQVDIKKNAEDRIKQKQLKSNIKKEISSERISRIKSALIHASKGNLSKAHATVVNAEHRKKLLEEKASLKK